MAATPSRGSYAKTQQIRQAIAAAAHDLVQERGHVDVTTSDIAARAGMRKSAALYHFASKDHMLIAALEEHGRRTQATESLHLADVPAQAERGVHRERIVRLHQALLAESHNPNHPAHEHFQKHVRSATGWLEAEIKAYQQQGLIDESIDAKDAARLIFSSWGGLQTQWLIIPDFSMADAMTQVISSVLGPAFAPQDSSQATV